MQIRCPNCNAPIQVKEGAVHIRCLGCGKEYQLKQSEVRMIDYANRGPIFQAYVPQDWSYGIFDDTDSISSLAAICKGLQLVSQSGAQIVFYPFALYSVPRKIKLNSASATINVITLVFFIFSCIYVPHD